MDGMTEFRLTYDGPALENHEIDSRELAPALLAMADLLESAARVLYGDKVKININVKGSFKTGSFNVDFVAGVQWLQVVRDMFAGAEATAIANATAILTALAVIGKKGSSVNFIVWDTERSSFVAPAPEELLIIDDVRDMAFSIVSLAFKEDNKWRLSDGSSTISATISDVEFLHAVNNDFESFSKGDSLVCRVRVRQWQTSNGTRTEYEVIKVTKHLRAARQIALPWNPLENRAGLEDPQLQPEPAA